VKRTLFALAALSGLAVVFRKQLLHLFTRTTGTWVGTKD
jgi:hypothetical protein